MLLSIGVSLYSSRIVLNFLGVKDYGIYNVVASIMLMVIFLNSAMSAATSRFMSFELGRGDLVRLKKTFSAAFTIHLIIAILILFFGETIGLWFLEKKMVIPHDRMHAARWLYQFSILSSMIMITQEPYDAAIIAHEKMGIYAYVEILNSILRLVIVYMLQLTKSDRLIFYGILLLVVSFIIAFVYRFYCLRNFKECKYKFEWDKKTIHPMLSFSGWNLYLNMSLTGKTQGINMLLNIFFGVTLNAAYGISMAIQGMVVNFSNNFLTAIRPRIVKHYASQEFNEMENLMLNASKFSFLLLFLVAFPIMAECEFILHIWLKTVPQYTVEFCQFSLISGLISSLYLAIAFANHATGKMKGVGMVIGSIYLIVLPVSYVLLKIYSNPYIPFIVNIVLTIIGCQYYIVNLRKSLMQIKISRFYVKSVMPCLAIILLSSIVPLWLHVILFKGWSRLFAVCGSFLITFTLTTYYIGLDKKLRNLAISVIVNKLGKLKIRK